MNYSKLSEYITASRTDRFDEWSMDELSRKVKKFEDNHESLLESCKVALSALKEGTMDYKDLREAIKQAEKE